MHIELTTPHVYDPGHGKPSITSTVVKVREFLANFEDSRITLDVHYGNLVDGVWVNSGAPTDPHTIRNTEAVYETPELPVMSIDPETGEAVYSTPPPPAVHTPADPAYDAIVSKLTSAAGVPIYGEVAYHVYAHLLAVGAYAGSIVI